MDFEQIVNELVELSKKSDGIIEAIELVKFFPYDSDDFDKLQDALEAKGVTVNELNLVQDDSNEEPNLADVEEVDISSYNELPPQIRVDDPVRMYLKEIGKIALLTPEEERLYSEQVLVGREAREELDKIERQIELDAKEGKEVKTPEDILGAEKYAEYEAAIDTAQYAKEKLISANLRLVVAIAKKYISRGLQFLDLIQEGNLGLMKAVDKFDYKKGYKFSTYATWWIRQGIARAVADQARTIRIPVHMVETINKLVKIQRQLVQELSREPSIEEIADRMGISVEKVQTIQRIAQDPISLEQPVGEEDDSSLGDFISDPSALDPYEYTAKRKLRKELDGVLATLTPREERVLRLRFGLIDGRCRTLEEVGKEFNVTRERIRQIEFKALRKLKHPTKSKKLVDFLIKY